MFRSNSLSPVAQLALVLLAAGTARTQDCDFTPERPSRDYDVHHYKLVLAFDDSARSVSGTAFITLSPLAAQLDSLAFDAVDLSVASVRSTSGKSLPFASRSPHLIVTLDSTRTPRDTITVAIEYSAFPKAGLYFIQPDSLQPQKRWQIWSQGQEQDNRHWFPCFDGPNDFATSELIATVHERYTVLSNGKLISQRHNPPWRTRTFHWKQSHPHASYLIMIAAGEYEVVHDTVGTVPLSYYVYPDRREDCISSLGRTPEVMQFLQEYLGVPYPWEKFAQVFIADFMYGGMENTTAVTLNDHTYIIDPRASVDFTADDVVAHELTHMWWGDLVTCRDWSHMWLHEGFATYLTSLYVRHSRGPNAFQFDTYQKAREIILREETKGRQPVVCHPNHATNLYAKASWVIRMLSDIVGEDRFREVMRNVLRQQRNLDTHEFQLAVEDVTGRNMAWFFRQWLYGAGIPELNASVRWDAPNNVVTVVLEQAQTQDSLTGTFVLPLTIECTTPEGTTRESFWMTVRRDSVKFAAASAPLMVIVDPGRKVLMKQRREIGREEHLYRLRHAADIVDRIESAKALRRYGDDEEVFRALLTAARTDVFHAVRQEAVISLGATRADSLNDVLLELYSDPHASVRRAVIVALEQFPTKEIADFIEAAAATDSSYLVLSSCIAAMLEVDSARAFAVAERYIGMESYRDIVRRAAINAMSQSGDPRSLPYALRYAASANPLDIRLRCLQIIEATGERDSTARAVVARLAADPEPAIRSSVARMLGFWGDESARALLHERLELDADPDVRTAISSALGTGTDR